MWPAIGSRCCSVLSRWGPKQEPGGRALRRARRRSAGTAITRLAPATRADAEATAAWRDNRIRAGSSIREPGVCGIGQLLRLREGLEYGGLSCVAAPDGSDAATPIAPIRSARAG